MVATDSPVRRRLLFILHRGFVEARLLALSERSQQLFDLADALETIPGCLEQWNEEDLEAIRFNLQNYQRKHGPRAFDYLSYLGEQSPPERF